ncbi:M28 family peptidase [Ulvibacterium marinum]|uniref:M28 family peptidase n=1 Tax=Ulvibacterium marinum TaxID=2419782 RepID=A0A3B0C470_9FLAO|nr:M28 family peptidase [Ulvibacterium marinum]RKN80875.1 M28 family peptidase [Ulvibacterium marinum]
MKNIVFAIVGLAMACNSSQKPVLETAQDSVQETSSISFAETITEAELKEHLYTYASDEFEGRETGKPGQKKAVEYLKSEYTKLGIPAAKDNGVYFQDVPLEINQLPTGSVNLNTLEYSLGEHILTFNAANASYKEIVYAGYGIEEDGYSDYEGLDVTGKMVLVKSGEPKKMDGTYKISGTQEKSIWSDLSESLGKRMKLASEKGAKGILYYDAANYSRFKSQFRYRKNNNNEKMELRSKGDQKFDKFFIDTDFAKALFPEIENESTSRTVQVQLEFKISSQNEMVNSENVAAILKGSEKPDEYIIISSHLDHIGVTLDGDVNNGADDDGSGTVAMLEIAEAFKKAADAGKGPKRSIVFLHVTGEEKGLLGSLYYTDFEPIFPLNQTVANLNIDMIGRIDPKREGDRNYVYLIGSDKLSTDLHQLSEEVNKRYTNLELDYTYNDENDPNRFYYRSDHYNFAKNTIPIIFYFNGTHNDYHRPGDTPDKINYDLLMNRTKLIFHTAWEVANRDRKVVADKVSK